MIRHLFFSAMLAIGMTACAQQVTKLPQPDMKRKTLSVMESFEQRRSIRSYSDKSISVQDLSDLLWAAQGKNSDDGRLTAPTAMNRQEIILYVFTEKGVCLYDPQEHTLTQVADGDHRNLIAGRQEFAQAAPLSLLMVADMDKFGSNNQHAQQMVCMDAGIVSENINIFCAAAGLATVTRASMEHKALQKLLGLKDTQLPLINNPVGYTK